MKYKAALFDMDGTILESLEDMNDAVNYTLAHFGYESNTLSETRAYVGNGAARLIRLSLPEDCDDESFNAVLSYYKDYYNEHARVKTAEYAGITDMLMSLKAAGMKLAVVSNKPDSTVQELTEYFFKGVFLSAVGESADVRRKPAPDSVNTAAALMGVSKDECVYIGDSEVDILTAKNAGMDCISVTWGFRDRAELIQNGAETLVDTVTDLKAYLLS